MAGSYELNQIERHWTSLFALEGVQQGWTSALPTIFGAMYFFFIVTTSLI